jgi:NAD(P)-dependent dehydrogenase (short-subunit alcohol dehydrogenase family)/acyl carrier protein
VLLGAHAFGDHLGSALEEHGASVTRPLDGKSAEELLAHLTALPGVRGIVDLRALGLQPQHGPDSAVAVGAGAMHLFQACAQLPAARPPRLWFLTQQAQPVTGAVRNSLQAVVWGLGRVAGHFELPSLWGGLADIDEPSRANAATLARQLLSDDREDQVGVYDGRRFVPRIREAPVRRSDVAPLRRDGAYLITGGLGALGLKVADWMVDRGARHIILVGRTALPARTRWSQSQDTRVRAVQALEAKGASVELHACDVADPVALTELRDGREREGRPPIRGVVHSAGTSTPRLLVSMTDDDFRSITRAKVQGGWALDQVFATGLDLFVLFSSIASLVVSAGQANYAAGNAYLDSLAHERRGRGEPAVTVNWGPWGDVGMATQLDLVDFFVSRGLHPTTSAQGTAALGDVLMSGLTQVAPIAAEWPVAIKSYPLGVAPAMLDEVGRTDVPRSGATGPADELASAQERLAEATPQERPDLIARIVHTVTAGVLRYAEAELPARSALTSLGLDSMIAIELKGRLEKALRVNVPIVSLLKGSTLDELISACAAQLLTAPEFDDEVADVLAAAEGLDIADMVKVTNDEC